MPAYLAEKAKNLASKEDLAQLTQVVESVKASHAIEIERLKAALSDEAQSTERRRKIYEEVCDALRVFIDGHGSSNDSREKFHAAYATAWLWASDEVVSQLNRFIALQRQHFEDRKLVSQTQLKAAYVEVILAMRKDTGFPSTTVQSASYQFVQFA